MSSGNIVLLRFDILHFCIYCNTYRLTLYFQVQFIKAYRTIATIKCALKKEQLLAKQGKDVAEKNVMKIQKRKDKQLKSHFIMKRIKKQVFFYKNP